MDIRHLRYFTAVAEERHFTRAAERLGIGQPPLSQQIQQLEREIGSPLFHRLSRGVELTAVGEVFLNDAKAILAMIEQAVATAHQVARGEVGRVRLGMTITTTSHPLIPAIIRDYRAQYPGVQLSLEVKDSTTLSDEVRHGQLDAAFVRARSTEALGTASHVVLEEELMVAVPNAHRLAGSPEIDLAEVAADDFIYIPRAVAPNLYDVTIAACQRAGFSPRVIQEIPSFPPLLNMVEAGMGVTIVPASMARAHLEGVQFLCVRGANARSPISVVYRSNEGAMAVRNLVTLARWARETSVRPAAPVAQPGS